MNPFKVLWQNRDACTPTLPCSKFTTDNATEIYNLKDFLSQESNPLQMFHYLPKGFANKSTWGCKDIDNLESIITHKQQPRSTKSIVLFGGPQNLLLVIIITSVIPQWTISLFFLHHLSTSSSRVGN